MTVSDNTRNVLSSETWDRVSEEYLAGTPAPELAERYDVGERTVRLRAKKGGWRRVDQDDPEPQEVEVDPAFADPDATPGALADICWQRMTAALSQGRFVEAARWEKFHRVCRTRARELEAEADRARRQHNAGLYAEIAKVTRMAEEFKREHGRAARTPPPATHSDNALESEPQTGPQPTPAPRAALHGLHGLHGAKAAPPEDPDEPHLDRAERRRRMKAAMKRLGKGGR